MLLLFLIENQMPYWCELLQHWRKRLHYSHISKRHH